MVNRIRITAIISSLFLLAADAGYFAPQELGTAAALRDRALEGSEAYNLAASLTTEVGPRLAGSPGDWQAVRWAAMKFKELGFDRVWTEPVPIDAWARGEEMATIVAPFPQKLVVTALGLSEPTPEDGIEAEIAHFETLADLMEAPLGSLDGRIAFISNRMERTRDGSGYGPAVQARSRGAIEAAKRGAVALLIRSIGTDNHRVPHTGGMRYEDGAPRIPAAALANPDADLLVRQLGYDQPVVVRLKLETERIGLAVSANVIGEITGSEKPEEVIILGAHLDSWDLGTGAIDDGAGVGIAMAAAHLIGQLEERPKRTIRVVLFAAEEVGLVGARKYLEDHLGELRNHIIGAESDFGAGRIWRLSSGVSENAVPVMDAIASVLEPLGIERGGNEAGGGPDLTPLRGAGMAVAGLDQDGTLYFDLHHTPDDTMDKIDRKAMDQNAAAYAVFAYLAAQYDGRFD